MSARLLPLESSNVLIRSHELGVLRCYVERKTSALGVLLLPLLLPLNDGRW
jgi:hypothetical protein